MKNITLAIDERVLENARAYAAQQGTTINAIVRQHLEQVSGNAQRLAEAKRELRDMSERSQARMEAGWHFSREETYADRDFPRHERPDLRGIGEER